MNNIFLKPGSEVTVNGEVFTSEHCIVTELSAARYKALLGDAIESVIPDCKFYPEAHTHRFSGYKWLKEKAA